MVKDLLEPIQPTLELIRSWILTSSEFIARAFELDPVNVSIVIMIVLSYLIGKWIFEMFYTDTQGRTGILVLIVGLLFYIIKFL